MQSAWEREDGSIGALAADATEASIVSLEKVPTGIRGFDPVTQGGLPARRTTLLCGGAGCGKTIFAAEFLVRGALKFGEPGAFIAFEETETDLVANFGSMGFDVVGLQKRNLLSIDHVRVDPAEAEENGAYDLEPLFLRISAAIDRVGAKRLVIDTLETLFIGLKDHTTVRSELRRLFRWLGQRGVTSIVTAEKGDGVLTRHGFEEYVSDCVILLDHRVRDQVSTRRVRVVKYRGSSHGSNEYPFIIDPQRGISIIPITSSDLRHDVSDARVDTGIPTLNLMLGGTGYFAGSTVLVSGNAGVGKTSIAAHFAAATCGAGERTLFVSYEESPSQLSRNARSIGIDLAGPLASGLLRVVAHRPTTFGLEAHLALLYSLVEDFEPRVVIVDPIGSMHDAGADRDAQLMLVRLVDLLKARGITALLTSLTHTVLPVETSDTSISSIVDTWLALRGTESNGERTRVLSIMKSRGMSHSNQIREFMITPRGVELVAPYVGAAGVLTGTARVVQEARDASEARRRQDARRRVTQLLDAKRSALERRIAELRAEFAAEEVELLMSAGDTTDSDAETQPLRAHVERARGVAFAPPTVDPRGE